MNELNRLVQLYKEYVNNTDDAKLNMQYVINITNFLKEHHHRLLKYELQVQGF
jgi:hypothetical protein